MSDWQERITRETAPAIRAEHELRYRLAAPLIAASVGWADLGCGNGLAAAAVLGSERPAHVVLVDIAERRGGKCDERVAHAGRSSARGRPDRTRRSSVRSATRCARPTVRAS